MLLDNNLLFFYHDLMEAKNKQSVVAAFIVEGVIVLVLVTAILVTLNYFGIVPLSRTFSFLSFLPSQTRIQSGSLSRNVQNQVPRNQGTSAGQQKSVITSESPMVVENTAKEFKYEPVKNGFINPRGELTIEADLTVGENVGGGTGIVFTNGLGFDDDNRRSLGLYFYPKDGNWLIEYRANNKSEYRGIKVTQKAAKFKLIVGPLGKSVLVTSGSDSVNFQFSSSLYDAGKQMRMGSQVGPNSTLTINSLTYN
jgi:hypothetical protein